MPSFTGHFAPTDKYPSLRTEHCTDFRVSDEVLKDACLTDSKVFPRTNAP